MSLTQRRIRETGKEFTRFLSKNSTVPTKYGKLRNVFVSSFLRSLKGGVLACGLKPFSFRQTLKHLQWRERSRKKKRFDVKIPPVIATSTKNDNKKYTENKKNVSSKATNLKYDPSNMLDRELNKFGVTVTYPVIFKTASLKNRAMTIIKIKNEGAGPIVLKEVHQVRSKRRFKLKVKFPLTLPPKKECSMSVSFTPNSYGMHRTEIVFNFVDFEICRFVGLELEDPLIKSMDLVDAKKPYKKKKRKKKRKLNRNVTVGQRPPSAIELYKLPLGKWKIPKDLSKQFSNLSLDATNNSDDVELNIAPSDYRDSMHKLLWLEECQMNVDIRNFDIENVTMESRGPFLVLEVPGLAENRPSVLKGDHIFVEKSFINHIYNNESKEESHKTQRHKGFVWKVEMETLLLKFHPSFHKQFIKGTRFDVQFTFNRVQLQVLHQTIDRASLNIMFPTMEDNWYAAFEAKARPAIQKNKLFNCDLNESQRLAVGSVVGRNLSPDWQWPFIIYGPPGTGKTVTLVEMVKQIYNNDSNEHILVAAPSNSAADLLVQRLLTGGGAVQKHHLLRVVAYQRNVELIPADVKNVTNYDASVQGFPLPSVEKLSSPTVVVATCMMCAKLYARGVATGHFSFAFVDEAGQALEPECTAAFAGLLSEERGSLVLCGDPKQLGPIIRSSLAKQLKTSLLERLMDENNGPYYKSTEITNNMGYNSNFLVKLIENYRSHPSIIKLPNEKFYSGDLIASANKIVRCQLLKWPFLPNNSFPVLFHGLVGRDMREGSSPSWFNPTEVCETIHYIQRLLDCRELSPRIQLKDIGIVAPYRRQVQKLRRVFKDPKYRWEDIKVGSVEEFQGRERKIIIINTVRSNADWLQMDKEHNIGFLNNPKRFNVAVTRAKALLIIIGNPFVLSGDDNWGDLLKYCIQNKSYVGCEFELNDIKPSSVLKISEIRKLARSLKNEVPSSVFQELTLNSISRVITFVGVYEETTEGSLQLADILSTGKLVSVKIEVYYTTGKVKTSLEHPKRGKTQLFRGTSYSKIGYDALRKIFENPRAHADVTKHPGWSTKEQRVKQEEREEEQWEILPAASQVTMQEDPEWRCEF
eukprot:g538.t1